MADKNSNDEVEPGANEDQYDLDVDLDEETDPDTDRIMLEALEAVDRRIGQGSKAVASHDLESGSDGKGDVQFAEMRAELEEVKERALRTLADYENYRRRVAREKAESRREAEMGPLREILPVIDNLERALAAEGGVDDLKQGVELIQRQLLELVGRFGVEPLPAAEGQPFDPTRHEAIFREEDDAVDAPMVSAEVQRGYLSGDRLLRPSMVHVVVPVGDGAAAGRGDESDADD